MGFPPPWWWRLTAFCAVNGIRSATSSPTGTRNSLMHPVGLPAAWCSRPPEDSFDLRPVGPLGIGGTPPGRSNPRGTHRAPKSGATTRSHHQWAPAKATPLQTRTATNHPGRRSPHGNSRVNNRRTLRYFIGTPATGHAVSDQPYRRLRKEHTNPRRSHTPRNSSR